MFFYVVSCSAVCIGITNKIDAAQLEDICPQADRRMSVNDFDDLIKLMAEQVAVGVTFH